MLYDAIKKQMIEALKNKEPVRLSVLREVLAGSTNELVAQKRKPTEIPSDDDMLKVIRRLSKQHKESIEQFEKGGRKELAEKERKELSLLEDYLPKMMSHDEIHAHALAKKQELGLVDKSKMGMFVGVLMKELMGRADGSDVKVVVEKLLDSN